MQFLKFCSNFSLLHQFFMLKNLIIMLGRRHYRPLSHNAETKDFARLTSHPVRGQMCKNKAFCSPGTQNGRRVIKVYYASFCSHKKACLKIFTQLTLIMTLKRKVILQNCRALCYCEMSFLVMKMFSLIKQKRVELAKSVGMCCVIVFSQVTGAQIFLGLHKTLNQFLQLLFYHN